jgi:hypothetical protein
MYGTSRLGVPGSAPGWQSGFRGSSPVVARRPWQRRLAACVCYYVSSCYRR